MKENNKHYAQFLINFYICYLFSVQVTSFNTADKHTYQQKCSLLFYNIAEIKKSRNKDILQDVDWFHACIKYKHVIYIILIFIRKMYK